MKISNLVNQCHQLQFKAKLQAEYNLKKDKTQKVKMRIYELEGSDLNYWKILSAQYSKQCKSGIFDWLSKDVIQILSEKSLNYKDVFHRTNVYLGFIDKKPVGVLVGNMPKMKKNWQVRYSSEPNASLTESELDWIYTMKNNNPNIKYIGQALLNHFSIQNLKNGFYSIFVRSATPTESPKVLNFYYQIGFKNFGIKSLFNNPENNQKIIKGDYEYEDNDFIIPLKLFKKDMIIYAKKIANLLNRREIKSNISYNLEKITE